MMNNQEKSEVKTFLNDDPEFKITISPYRPGSLRIVCCDQVLLIHEAEVIDLENYVKEVNELRKDKQDRRIRIRHNKVEHFLKGPHNATINPFSFS